MQGGERIVEGIEVERLAHALGIVATGLEDDLEADTLSRAGAGRVPAGGQPEPSTLRDSRDLHRRGVEPSV